MVARELEFGQKAMVITFVPLTFPYFALKVGKKKKKKEKRALLLLFHQKKYIKIYKSKAILLIAKSNKSKFQVINLNKLIENFTIDLL